VIFDLNISRAQIFQERCSAACPGVTIRIAGNIQALLHDTRLISLATTASKPHIHDLGGCAPGTVILNISLRDLSPEVVLTSDNVVDDVSHVCRAQTSIHLAEQQVGHRNFIRCTLADILNGAANPRLSDSDITIFSPFGLGILDIALGEYVLSEALSHGKGIVIPSFIPHSWNRTGFN
jgi:ornithine cyclodeaminase